MLTEAQREPLAARIKRARLPYTRPLSLLRHQVADGWRLWRYGGLHPTRHSLETKRALLTIGYHQVEKGLSLAPSKPWFGEVPVRRTLAQAEAWQEELRGDPVLGTAVDALVGYVAANATNPRPPWADDVEQRVERLSRSAGCGSCAPIVRTTREELRAAVPADPEAFWETRHSIRQFADEPVAWEELERAVRIAQISPRVCNREAVGIHAFQRGPEADAVLALQSGNRGFGDRAPWVLVITVDTSFFTTVGERNQCWIDGGIFTMSLVLALHSIGLGSCCLNWSQPLGPDRALRELIGLRPSDVVITMLAVGVPAAELAVARSASRDVGDVLRRGRVRSVDERG